MSANAAMKAISEPRRQELLEILRDEGELTVGQLAEKVTVTQQAVSLHLKVLVEADLVEARREGTKHIYAVRPEGFKPVQDFVGSFWKDQLATLKSEIEEK